MKTVFVLLSAAVVGGLGCYWFFNSLFGFGLMGNAVVINVDLFVAFVASLSMVAAALALLFRQAMMRSDERQMAKLERRIAELEMRAKTEPA